MIKLACEIQHKWNNVDKSVININSLSVNLNANYLIWNFDKLW